jgi:DNA-binding CsgD family transcriptional regulator
MIHGHCTIAVPKPTDRETLVAIVSILETARTRRNPIASFAAVHGLSPQETRLLAAATSDPSKHHAADVLGCTESTVRTYWGRIFQKTQCHRARQVLTRLLEQATGELTDL